MLNKAALCYKVRLVTDHPFPEMKGRKLRFLEEAWKKAYQMIDSGDFISFNSQAQKFVSSFYTLDFATEVFFAIRYTA